MKAFITLFLPIVFLHEISFCMEKKKNDAPRKVWQEVLGPIKELEEESSPKNMRRARPPANSQRASSAPDFTQGYSDFFKDRSTKKDKGKEKEEEPDSILCDLQSAFKIDDYEYCDVLISSYVDRYDVSRLLSLLEINKDTLDNNFGIFLCSILRELTKSDELTFILKNLNQFFQAQSPLKRTMSGDQLLSQFLKEDHEFAQIEENYAKDNLPQLIDCHKYLDVADIAAYTLLNNSIILATKSGNIALYNLNFKQNTPLYTIKDNEILIPHCFIESYVHNNQHESFHVTSLDTLVTPKPLSLISVQNPLTKALIIGEHIIIAEPGRTLFTFNTRTHQSIELEATEFESCDCLCALDTTSFITTFGRKILLWDIKKYEQVGFLELEQGTVSAAIVLNNFMFVLNHYPSALKLEAAIVLCDFLKKTTFTVYKENDDTITALHSSGPYLFAGMSNGSIKILNSKKQKGFNNFKELMVASNKSINSLQCYEDTLLVVNNNAIAAYRKFKKNNDE